MELTKEMRYRTTLIRGRLVLQVEIRRFVFGSGWQRKWLDAKARHLRHGIGPRTASTAPENTSLTGRTRLRRSAIRGLLILQVETARKNWGTTYYDPPPGSEIKRSWRDARVKDLTLLGSGAGRVVDSCWWV